MDVNVEVVAKHYPTLLDETFKFKLQEVGRAKFISMALTLKRKSLVACVLLELFEDGNDGFKRAERERVEKGIFTARYTRA